ncbi:MAG: L,D-transpeptidase family protein [Acidobacteriia bacterium]|nr:L,D-transpeptidase family protein [Terriglobia bacterium]
MRRQMLLAGCSALLAAVLYAQWPAAAGPSERPSKVLVFKQEHKLILLRGDTVLKTYRVALGRNPLGPKTSAGDHRTPEGLYALDWQNPQSKFHFSIHISYPNAKDVANAHRQGVQPGGDIMIHGLQDGLGWIGRFHRFVDWTDGCIAVTNAEMDQIRQAVPIGTPIEIRP